MSDKEISTMSDAELEAEYEQLSHAVQTGVMHYLELNPKFAGSKFLKTGNDLRAVDHHAIVTLLIQKGIITEREYLEQLVKSTREEVRRYETILSKAYSIKANRGDNPVDIKLH